jgi:hypothetical protein
MYFLSHFSTRLLYIFGLFVHLKTQSTLQCHWSVAKFPFGNGDNIVSSSEWFEVTAGCVHQNQRGGELEVPDIGLELLEGKKLWI